MSEFRTVKAGTFENSSFSFRHRVLMALALWVLGLSVPTVKAQTYVENAGTPTFTTALPVEGGFFNAANGNIHLEIPLGSFPQRAGQPLVFALAYDSAMWSPTTTVWQPTNISGLGGGPWRLISSADPGSLFFSEGTVRCKEDGGTEIAIYSAFAWTSPDGTTHSFPIITTHYLPTECNENPSGSTPTGSAYASDATGYYMSVTNYTGATVQAPDGTLVFPNHADTNGNYYYTSSGNIVDTLGRTPVTATTNGNTITYSVLNEQGGTSTYTVTTESISVDTNFGQSGITECSSCSVTVIKTISLPDGTSYSFNYDSGTTAGHYGLLTSMTLPTGATITYQWQVFSDAMGNRYEWLQKRTTPDGTWQYAPAVVSFCASAQVNCQQTNTITKPSGDTTVYTLVLNGGAWQGEAQTYTGSSSLLSTVNQCWNFVTITNGECTYSTTNGTPAINVTKSATTTTMPTPSGSVSATNEYSYDSYGNTTQISEWNFGNSPANPADRNTAIVYETGSYITANILNLPQTITVSAKYNNTEQYTWLGHDQYALTSVTGMANHDDTNYGTGNNLRGNLTQLSRLVSGTTYLNTLTYYDTTGEPTKTYVSGVGNPTTYTNVCQNAYPSIVTNPLSQITTLGYDCNTGLLTSVKDANNQTTSFSYDNMGRPLTTTYPNGGQTSISYNYSGSTFTGSTTTQRITSSVNLVTQQNLDTLGRDNTDVVTSDPDGQTTVATHYDSNGRIKSVSNPYHSTSDSTYGVTQTSYDGVDRPGTVTDQDNSTATSYYGPSVGPPGAQTSQLCSGFGVGYPILYIDEAGKKRQTWTDAFGNLIETDEPDSNNNLTVSTCYAHDLLGNLIGVLSATKTQTCTQYDYFNYTWAFYSRCYSYDMISRLFAATDPESGTTYTRYINSAGYLCSGDPSAACTRTDARGITTTYQYDSLSRLIEKTYSDSTPTVTYSYDSTSCLGLPNCYNIGRRTGMSDGSGSSSWAYDSLGDVLLQSQTINTVTKPFSYTYNLDGSLATITYPSSRTLTYSPGGAGRSTAVTDTTNSNSPIPYASSVHYSPFGALSSMMNGPSNILSTWWYSNRLQPCRIAVNTSGSAPSNCNDSNTGNVIDLAYNFSAPSNNGNVLKISNNRTGMSGRNVNFAYDNLNRIAQAYTDATTGSYCWAETYAIDPVGNMTSIGSKSDHSGCSQESLNLVATWQNRLSTGFGSDYEYDAAGNLTRTPSPESASYSYNAEEQLTQASDFFTAGYLYDGDGKRVAKTSGGTPYQLYWYGTNSAPLTVSDGSGNLTDEYVFFAGRRIARRVVSGQ